MDRAKNDNINAWSKNIQLTYTKTTGLMTLGVLSSSYKHPWITQLRRNQIRDTSRLVVERSNTSDFNYSAMSAFKNNERFFILHKCDLNFCTISSPRIH